jgi:hypothetical protein
MARPRSPLTTFILSLSTALPIKDVIARAKANGMKTTEQNVSRVRKMAGGKAAKGAKKALAKSKTPVKPTPATSHASKPSKVSKSAAPKKGGANKAAFVRARAHLSPKEIVEDAKADGLKLAVGYVYNVRGQDKTLAKKKRAVTATSKHASATSTPTASHAIPRSAGTHAETLLRAVAAEVGIGHAIEILQGERARIRAIIGT